MAAVWRLLDGRYSFPSCVPSRLTTSHWRAVIADDCDIIVYWCGRKYYISQNHPLIKNKAQRQASWLSLWSRWYLEADTGHRPLTCRLDTEALQATMPKIARGPRNVTNRIKTSPWQQGRGQRRQEGGHLRNICQQEESPSWLEKSHAETKNEHNPRCWVQQEDIPQGLSIIIKPSQTLCGGEAFLWLFDIQYNLLKEMKSYFMLKRQEKSDSISNNKNP